MHRWQQGPSSSYSYDINSHQEINVWTGDDSSLFVSGSTRATKNITYTGSSNGSASHSWTNVEEVKAKRGVNGVKAHQVCTVCGAMRLTSDPSKLITDEDLVLTHTCSYQVSFDWSNAVNPGDKPIVTYTCTDSYCGYTHTLSSSEVVLNEKANSRIPATFDTEGSVIFIASSTYDNHEASEEKSYVLPKTTHTLVYHPAVDPTCDALGTIGYYECSDCHKLFSDAAGKNEITDITIPISHTLVHHDAKSGTCLEIGNIEYYECSLCHKKFSDAEGKNEVSSILDGSNSHSLVHHEATVGTCVEPGTMEYYECSLCHKMFSNALGTDEITSVESVPGPHSLIHFDAVEATCLTEGTVEYYECSLCHKKYSDSTGTIEIDNIVTTKEHTLTRFEGVNPTCDTDGVMEYYECSSCHKKFSDSEGKNEVTDTLLPKRHTLIHFDAVEATCTTIGNIEYYHCSKCDKNFDSELNEVDDPFIPYKHSFVKYNAKAATCERDGNVEYYHCNNCNKNFSDALGEHEINDVVIQSKGHQYGDDGICTVCGITKPNYKPTLGCFSSVSGSLVFFLAGLGIVVLRKRKENI